MKNCCIYTPSEQALIEEHLTSIPHVDTIIKQSASSYLVSTIESSFVMNSMPSDSIPNHINGFIGYVYNYHTHKNIEDLDDIVSYLEQVKQVYGIVFNDEIDFESNEWLIIKNIATAVEGVIFTCDSLVDPNDMVIFGPLGE